MKATLVSRLKWLEGRALVSREPFTLRFGPLRRLPREYVGERHVAILKQLPSETPDREWYELGMHCQRQVEMSYSLPSRNVRF